MIDLLKRRLLTAIGRLTPGGGLAEQAVKSTVWVGGLNVVDRVLQLATITVMARLLAPSEFGLFGIALLSLNAVKRFTKLGLDDALIHQKEDNVDGYLNTMWSLEIARGVVIAGVLFLAAPFVAQFFGEPEATGPLRGIALTPVLLGLRNPAIVYFKKNLDFHKEFLYTISGSVTLPVVAIGYALVNADVWALIIGFVAADAVRLPVSYLIHGYRPSPQFERAYADELIGYGKWVTGSSMASFLTSEGDDVVVGWLLSPAALAFYQMSYRFSNAPATEVSQTIGSVTFPMYSKLQDDMEQLRETFYQTLQVVSFVAFPMGFGIAAVAPTFVRAFFGPKWLPMVTTMQLLAAYGLLRALGKQAGAVWKAVGRPDYTTKLPLIRIVLMAIFIYPVTEAYGIEGTALLIVLIGIVMLPVTGYFLITTIGTTPRRLLRELAYPLAASAIMGLTVVSIREGLALESAIVEFFLLVGAGAIAYGAASAALDTFFDWGIWDSVRTIKGSI